MYMVYTFQRGVAIGLILAFFLSTLSFVGVLRVYEIELTSRVDGSDAITTCDRKGYDIERMDLIPYGRCLCNHEQACYCYPI